MKRGIRKLTRVIPMVLLGSVMLAAPAQADSTLFMAMTNGGAVPSFGVTWGAWHAPIGFELELSKSPGATHKRPGAATFGVNLLVDTPIQIHGARLYGSAGLGLLGKWDGSGAEIGGPAKNVGGGARIPIAGGILLRLDYRAFFVESGQGDYRPGHARRLAAGISFAF